MEMEKARTVVDGLKEAGVNFAAGLPDSQFHEVYDLISSGPSFSYVGVGNEGEGAAGGLGAWVWGQKTAVIFMGSGVFVADFFIVPLHLQEGSLFIIITHS